MPFLKGQFVVIPCAFDNGTALEGQATIGKGRAFITRARLNVRGCLKRLQWLQSAGVL